MKVIDYLGFSSPRGTCGLVIGEDEKTGKRVVKIGVVYGLDNNTDAQDLLEVGTEIEPIVLKGIATVVEEAKIKEPEPEPPAPAPEAKPAKPPKTKKAKGK